MGPIPDTALAFQNADILRAVRGHPGLTVTGIAKVTGRDVSNVSKTIGRLVDAGYMVRAPHLQLADAAGPILDAADVAEGRAAVAGDSGDSGDQDSNLLYLAHAEIRPDPDNARKDWDSEAARADLEALAADILDRGLLQNLIVRRDPEQAQAASGHAASDSPLYLLVGGERRWRAIGLLKARDRWPGKPERSEFIPCRLLDTDDLGHRLAALAENLQRRNLNPIEEANAYQGLRDAGLSAEQIGERVSVTARQVQMRLQLLQLDEADQQRMTLPRDDPKFLSVSDARNLVRRANEAAERRAEVEAALTPAQRLILAEVRLAQLTTRESGWWYEPVPVRPGLAREDADLQALVETNRLRVDGPDDDGAVTVRPAWQGVQDAVVLFGEGKRGPEAAAAALMAELDLTAPAGGYATPWLNGPFEVDEATAAAIAERKAQQAAREAQWEASQAADKAARQARLERMSQARARIRDERERHAYTEDRPQAAVLAEVARDIECPLPWAHDGEGAITDANGEQVEDLSGWGATDPGDAALAELIVLAVNSAAGLPTPDAPVRRAEDEDEEEDEGEADEPGSDADEAAADLEGGLARIGAVASEAESARGASDSDAADEDA